MVPRRGLALTAQRVSTTVAWPGTMAAMTGRDDRWARWLPLWQKTAQPTRRPGEAETERLLLLSWSDDYFGEFARVCQDPEAMRFISGGLPLTHQDIRAITRRTLAMWDEHGYGPWAAIEKRTGRWVGRIGLSLLADWPGPDKWEVGFELAPEYWGRGLATEGAREAIRFGWATTPLARIISVSDARHRASRRVMEKCGLAFQAEVIFREAEVAWYAIDRPGGPM